MRALISVGFVFWAAVATAQSRPPAPAQMPVQLDSKHYHLSSTADEDQARELLGFMEIVHKTYLQLLRPDDPKAVESKKFNIVLYRDSEEYFASGAPKGSGAYYNGKKLVGYQETYFMRVFFAHEGMHQFTDITSKRFRDFPMWFSEGIADCIGNSEARGKKLYMCLRAGGTTRMRLPIIQRALKDGTAYPLKRLLTLPRKEFMGNAGLAYAQSWSFCHFLMAYPKYDAGSGQIPNGTFRKNLAIYYELVRSGEKKHAGAWAEAFKGYTIEQLEALWKKYILAFDGPKLMGFNGKNLTDEECDALGLGKRDGAIVMEKFNDGSVGREAGCENGDVLVKVNGKTLPRERPLDHLRYVLGGWPFNRKLKIEVLRGEERKKLTLVWRKKK